MDESIRYPTWKDVGSPKPLLKFIRDTNNIPLIGYMAINRVFRYPVKAQYQYTCSCGHKKLLTRIYEDYLCCDNCGVPGRMVTTPQWRMGKDLVQEIDDGLPGLVIKQMHDNHINYFGENAPEGFFSCGWQLGNLKKTRAMHESGENEDLGTPPRFYAQFYSGDRIEGVSQASVICQAAILTPFLWDDLFDWRFYVTKDKSNETHLLPLVNMIVRLKQQSSRRLSGNYDNNLLAVLGGQEEHD